MLCDICGVLLASSFFLVTYGLDGVLIFERSYIFHTSANYSIIRCLSGNVVRFLAVSSNIFSFQSLSLRARSLETLLFFLSELLVNGSALSYFSF